MRKSRRAPAWFGASSGCFWLLVARGSSLKSQFVVHFIILGYTHTIGNLCRSILLIPLPVFVVAMFVFFTHSRIVSFFSIGLIVLLIGVWLDLCTSPMCDPSAWEIFDWPVEAEQNKSELSRATAVNVSFSMAMAPRNVAWWG